MNESMPASDVFDLVIFDCDGVLVDSEVLSCGCLSEMLNLHGYEIDLAGVMGLFLGRSFSVVQAHCAGVMGRPLDAAFVATLRTTLKERFARDLRAMDGVARVLEGLRTPCCVASSSDTERLAHSLTVTGLADRFGDRVYSSDLVANGKPAPDLFLHAAERMGARADRTLVIEDSVTGVLAARAAGMTVWGFVGGSHYADTQAGGPDGAAMLAQAGAHRIVRTMAELAI